MQNFAQHRVCVYERCYCKNILLQQKHCVGISRHFVLIVLKLFYVEHSTGTSRPPLTRRYELIRHNMNWISAVKYCISRKANLLMITNIHEQRVIANYLSSISSTSVCPSCFTSPSFNRMNVYMPRMPNCISTITSSGGRRADAAAPPAASAASARRSSPKAIH